MCDRTATLPTVSLYVTISLPLYLPPYSPDLKTIELAFSKFKRLLRDGARRTQEGLTRLCGRVLDLFNETEIRNYFRHCGYRYA